MSRAGRPARGLAPLIADLTAALAVCFWELLLLLGRLLAALYRLLAACARGAQSRL